MRRSKAKIPFSYVCSVFRFSLSMDRCDCICLKHVCLRAVWWPSRRFSSKVRRQGLLSDFATLAMDFFRAGAVQYLSNAYRARVQLKEGGLTTRLHRRMLDLRDRDCYRMNCVFV